MEKAIMKILGSYVSRNETCFVNEFESINELVDNKYEVKTLEIDKSGNEYQGVYYIVFRDNGISIECLK